MKSQTTARQKQTYIQVCNPKKMYFAAVDAPIMFVENMKHTMTRLVSVQFGH